MVRRLSDAVYRLSSGRVTLVALVAFLLFTALVLPREAARADLTASGAGSPDTSIVYTAQDLYHMADAYGPDGRRAYVRARWTFDVVWPLVYLAFLTTAISWLFARGCPSGGWRRQANLTPLAAALFDFLENSGASLVMTRYPAQTPIVDWLTPLFTLIKWLLIVVSFVLLLVGATAALGSRVRQAKGDP